jgi:hypothetical protein
MENSLIRLLKKDSEDLRFGRIDIFEDLESLHLYFTKETFHESEEKLRSQVEECQQRRQLAHPNLLRVLWTKPDAQKMRVVSAYVYPSSDLTAQSDQLQASAGQIRFLKDMLEVLAMLEAKDIVHGDVRPELIYFDEKEKNFVLIDRLADPSPPLKHQLNNLKFNYELFVAPELFSHMMTNQANDDKRKIAAAERQFGKEFFFKSDVFSLGMTLSDILCGNCSMQTFYDTENKQFRESLFREFLSDFRGQYSEKSCGSLGNFIVDFLLEPETAKRHPPSKVLASFNEIFQEELAKAKEFTMQSISISKSNDDSFAEASLDEEPFMLKLTKLDHSPTKKPNNGPQTLIPKIVASNLNSKVPSSHGSKAMSSDSLITPQEQQKSSAAALTASQSTPVQKTEDAKEADFSKESKSPVPNQILQSNITFDQKASKSETEDAKDTDTIFQINFSFAKSPEGETLKIMSSPLAESSLQTSKIHNKLNELNGSNVSGLDLLTELKHVGHFKKNSSDSVLKNPFDASTTSEANSRTTELINQSPMTDSAAVSTTKEPKDDLNSEAGDETMFKVTVSEVAESSPQKGPLLSSNTQKPTQKDLACRYESPVELNLSANANFLVQSVNQDPNSSYTSSQGLQNPNKLSPSQNSALSVPPNNLTENSSLSGYNPAPLEAIIQFSAFSDPASQKGPKLNPKIFTHLTNTPSNDSNKPNTLNGLGNVLLSPENSSPASPAIELRPSSAEDSKSLASQSFSIHPIRIDSGNNSFNPLSANFYGSNSLSSAKVLHHLNPETSLDYASGQSAQVNLFENQYTSNQPPNAQSVDQKLTQTQKEASPIDPSKISFANLPPPSSAGPQSRPSFNPSDEKISQVQSLASLPQNDVALKPVDNVFDPRLSINPAQNKGSSAQQPQNSNKQLATASQQSASNLPSKKTDSKSSQELIKLSDNSQQPARTSNPLINPSDLRKTQPPSQKSVHENFQFVDLSIPLYHLEDGSLTTDVSNKRSTLSDSKRPVAQSAKAPNSTNNISLEPVSIKEADVREGRVTSDVGFGSQMFVDCSRPAGNSAQTSRKSMGDNAEGSAIHIVSGYYNAEDAMAGSKTTSKKSFAVPGLEQLPDSVRFMDIQLVTKDCGVLAPQKETQASSSGNSDNNSLKNFKSSEAKNGSSLQSKAPFDTAKQTPTSATKTASSYVDSNRDIIPKITVISHMTVSCGNSDEAYEDLVSPDYFNDSTRLIKNEAEPSTRQGDASSLDTTVSHVKEPKQQVPKNTTPSLKQSQKEIDSQRPRIQTDQAKATPNSTSQSPNSVAQPKLSSDLSKSPAENDPVPSHANSAASEPKTLQSPLLINAKVEYPALSVTAEAGMPKNVDPYSTQPNASIRTKLKMLINSDIEQTGVQKIDLDIQSCDSSVADAAISSNTQHAKTSPSQALPQKGSSISATNQPSIPGSSIPQIIDDQATLITVELTNESKSEVDVSMSLQNLNAQVASNTNSFRKISSRNSERSHKQKSSGACASDKKMPEVQNKSNPFENDEDAAASNKLSHGSKKDVPKSQNSQPNPKPINPIPQTPPSKDSAADNSRGDRPDSQHSAKVPNQNESISKQSPANPASVNSRLQTPKADDLPVSTQSKISEPAPNRLNELPANAVSSGKPASDSGGLLIPKLINIKPSSQKEILEALFEKKLISNSTDSPSNSATSRAKLSNPNPATQANQSPTQKTNTADDNSTQPNDSLFKKKVIENSESFGDKLTNSQSEQAIKLQSQLSLPKAVTTSHHAQLANPPNFPQAQNYALDKNERSYLPQDKLSDSMFKAPSASPNIARVMSASGPLTQPFHQTISSPLISHPSPSDSSDLNQSVPVNSYSYASSQPVFYQKTSNRNITFYYADSKPLIPSAYGIQTAEPKAAGSTQFTPETPVSRSYNFAQQPNWTQPWLQPQNTSLPLTQPASVTFQSKASAFPTPYSAAYKIQASTDSLSTVSSAGGASQSLNPAQFQRMRPAPIPFGSGQVALDPAKVTFQPGTPSPTRPYVTFVDYNANAGCQKMALSPSFKNSAVPLVYQLSASPTSFGSKTEAALNRAENLSLAASSSSLQFKEPSKNQSNAKTTVSRSPVRDLSPQRFEFPEKDREKAILSSSGDKSPRLVCVREENGVKIHKLV